MEMETVRLYLSIVTRISVRTRLKINRKCEIAENVKSRVNRSLYGRGVVAP